jgi:hypothetical protein
MMDAPDKTEYFVQWKYPGKGREWETAATDGRKIETMSQAANLFNRTCDKFSALGQAGCMVRLVEKQTLVEYTVE